jgi:hypothetical protein
MGRSAVFAAGAALGEARTSAVPRCATGVQHEPGVE